MGGSHRAPRNTVCAADIARKGERTCAARPRGDGRSHDTGPSRTWGRKEFAHAPCPQVAHQEGEVRRARGRDHETLSGTVRFA